MAVGWREAIQTCGAVAGATPLGVKIGGLDEVQIGRESKMGKLQSICPIVSKKGKCYTLCVGCLERF